MGLRYLWEVGLTVMLVAMFVWHVPTILIAGAITSVLGVIDFWKV